MYSLLRPLIPSLFTRLLQDAPKSFILTIKVFVLHTFYFIQQEELKCQDQEEEAREGQEAAWAQVDLEGHRQEGPAPAFSGREAAGLGRAPAASMAAPGTMALAVFTAAPGTMALVCPRHLRRITIMVRAGALVLGPVQVDSGGRLGLRVLRATIMAAAVAGVVASSPSLLCW